MRDFGGDVTLTRAENGWVIYVTSNCGSAPQVFVATTFSGLTRVLKLVGVKSKLGLTP